MMNIFLKADQLNDNFAYSTYYSSAEWTKYSVKSWSMPTIIIYS
jgi:hypothetical protein